MEVEKKRSKGGFLNLFDWNGKSRKRLFSSSNELSGLKQGKENVDNLSKSQLFQLETSEDRASSSYKLTDDWDFSLTKTSEEKSGGRVPSVVARLMGLDSLPSNAPELCSTSFFESRSVRASHHDNSSGVWNSHSVDYIGMPNKLERFSGNLLDFRAQKVPKSPIERFQTEVLPPKSAKSIPITHHKLLSPIKSPGFTPTMNTCYLMEAATKIIEASPRKPLKSKMLSITNSSAPLRIRVLKENLETAHKSTGIKKPTENRKGKASEQNYSGSEQLLASRTDSLGGGRINSNTSKDKGRPASVAGQARANLHSRGESTSCSDRSSTDRKEHNEVKSRQLFGSQPSLQKPMQKRTVKRNNNVLAQNNQKQNSLPNKEKLPSKPSKVLNQPVKRIQSARKSVNKDVINSEVESKITRTREADGKEDFAPSKKNVAPRKKKSVSQDASSEGSCSVSNALIHDDERSVKYNIAFDGSTNCDENRKLGMDIVSFTFTSPLKKSVSEPHSDEVVKINHSLVFDSCSENDYLQNLSSFSPHLNDVNGDALSVLLEQKLQELTCRVEPSQSYMTGGGIFACSGSNSQNLFATSEYAKKENGISCRYPESPHDCDDLSMDSNELIVDKWLQFQGAKDIKEPEDSNDTETVTMSDSLIEDESSPDDGNSIHVQHVDTIKLDPKNLYSRMLDETPVFDSASSIDEEDKFQTLSPTMISPIKIHRPNDWELQYVREVLSKAELAFENFTLGVVNNLEIEENIKCNELEQKVLLDCVNECLERKLKQIVIGSSKTRVPWTKLFENDCLADELWKEIEGLKCSEEWMVDELVEKDMSTTQHGKWLNFDIEASEEGVLVEKWILSSLVDELVSDLLIIAEEA
ncbi:uncharacterized protein LOC111493645 isoform X1 [Cucurbita maxima]|uniref:Uncharacterized protein LOC111493645 isoform X1 n=1 Tax=Cucurbita maxima TaxID=3661 RepID=A0A6J1KA56_CUCMA|nr:uncharacterized protein LOC111493645 isoform X1 [Cucurbita maxima]XP_022999186.1 uncharacterized protein LOC111493645 isoform X1 [Cucurbita maxima]XP_022999187.1 uncharacterized protein LOC111493645 isoform X1 [Cucurbita maxima]